MADILIRGMEMPKSCVECLFDDDENTFCHVLSEYVPAFGEVPAKCPLVPLPEGHGRLVDAERFRVPAADVRPVVMGKWIRGNESRTSPTKDSYICSVCGEKTLSGFCGNPAKTNFCPNCGADMREVSEDG